MIPFGVGLAVVLAAWLFVTLLRVIKKKLRRFISEKSGCKN